MLKTVARPSYLQHGNPYTWERRSLYWDRAWFSRHEPDCWSTRPDDPAEIRTSDGCVYGGRVWFIKRPPSPHRSALYFCLMPGFVTRLSNTLKRMSLYWGLPWHADIFSDMGNRGRKEWTCFLLALGRREWLAFCRLRSQKATYTARWGHSGSPVAAKSRPHLNRRGENESSGLTWPPDNSIQAIFLAHFPDWWQYCVAGKAAIVPHKNLAPTDRH